jgi:hypothetical protein
MLLHLLLGDTACHGVDDRLFVTGVVHIISPAAEPLTRMRRAINP